MNYYNLLTDLVYKGQLEVLYIISPPRTLSTVLEIALVEYGHGQIHEPFHKRRRRNFNDGCRIVYERAIQLQEQFRVSSVKVVVKDLSKFVKPDEWRQLVNLANRFVFTIREPSRQIFSMASRYANDLDDYDVDKLDYQQILANLPRIPFEDLALGYWENLLKLLNITERHLLQANKQRKKKHLAIVSGMTFRSNPLNSVKKLMERLELDMDPMRILKGWKLGSGENFFRPEYIINYTERDKEFRRGAWLGHAVNSTSFDPLDPKRDAPQDIDIYDNRLQSYFLDNILPVFVDIYLREANICRPDADFVLNGRFIESKLSSSNPIEAYLLCASFLPKNKHQKVDKDQNCLYLRTAIEKKYPFIAKKLFEIVANKERRLGHEFGQIS